jgi:hypothetical protein
MLSFPNIYIEEENKDKTNNNIPKGTKKKYSEDIRHFMGHGMRYSLSACFFRILSSYWETN